MPVVPSRMIHQRQVAAAIPKAACCAGRWRRIVRADAANRGSCLETQRFVLSACSELKLKDQLDRARAANLVERVEPAIRAARSQTVRKRLRRAAE